jgi:hypothetical protein
MTSSKASVSNRLQSAIHRISKMWLSKINDLQKEVTHRDLLKARKKEHAEF